MELTRVCLQTASVGGEARMERDRGTGQSQEKSDRVGGKSKVLGARAGLQLTPDQPFFNLTLQAGNPRLAAIFIPKCSGVAAGETITMYEKCGMRTKAAEEAVRLKDGEAWQRLLEAAGRGSAEGREIERIGMAVFRK